MDRRTLMAAVTVAILAAVPLAQASDGCVEISQVNVATAGNIASPGCYVLTSDLTQGITIASSDVSVDLNGFTIAPASGSCVTVSGPVDNLEVSNGTLRGAGGNPAVTATPPGQWINHVYRNLRIFNDTGLGIDYPCQGNVLKNLQLENVVLSTRDSAVRIDGVSDVVVLRNLRINRCELRSAQGIGLEIVATGAIVMNVYGLQVESSAVNTETGVAAISINTAAVTDPDPEAAEFEGSIRNCDLVAPDTGALGVVHFDARQGALYCLGNTVEAASWTTGANNEYAFLAPGNAPLVIRNNTSRVVHTNGTPIWGNVISPPVGHDGVNYLLSNWNDPTGPY